MTGRYLAEFRRPFVVAGTAVAGLVSSYLVAIRRPVPGWELRLTEALNAVPEVGAWVMYPVMQAGTLAGPVVVAGSIAVVRRDLVLASAVALTGVGTWFGAKAIKQVVERDRPLTYLPDLLVREGDGAGLGYVSGHSAVAASAAIMVMVAIPRRWRPLAGLVAALVGVARIVRGVHLPADVVGGWSFGVLMGIGGLGLAGWIAGRRTASFGTNLPPSRDTFRPYVCRSKNGCPMTDLSPPTTTTTAAAPAARAVDAVKTYGSGDTTVQALAGVTVDFPAHQFTAIMGPSGSGKSTLMQCVAGLDRLTSGSVYVGDTELSKLDKTELTLLRRDRLGFIFQQYNLIPTLSSKENILLPLTLAGEDEDPAWFDTIVDTVGLGNRLDNLPSQLSGGQQQRVAVARALVPKPDIVFADEPTGALDSRTGMEILAFMRNAVDQSGQTIVMVTHDPHAASYANSVLFLADGQIIDEMQSPTTDRVLDRMKQFEG